MKLFKTKLRSHIKTQANLQAYPGKIYLPQNLYEQRPDEQRPVQEGQLKAKKGRGAGPPSSLMMLEGQDEDTPDWGSPIVAATVRSREVVEFG